MKLLKLTPDHTNIPLVKKLYETAFPPKERVVDMDAIVGMLDQMPLELIGIYPDEAPDTFAGFFVIYKLETFSYLVFFATCPEMRSKGLGSRAIQSLKQYCGDTPLVFSYESVFEECDNMEQRERRRSFYLKNGFYETGWFVHAMSTEFIIASSVENFDIDSLSKMIEEWTKNAPATTEKLELYRHEK